MSDTTENINDQKNYDDAKTKLRFKKSVKIAFFAILIVIVVVTIEFWYQNRPITQIHIKIKNQNDALTFLDSAEIFRLLTDNGKENIKGVTFKKISVKTLESRVKANLFVNKCEIARNLRGDLFVEISPSTPIARFLREGKPDFYIDSVGKVMPTSEKFTARVMLVSREDTKQLPDFAQKDKELLAMIKFIHQDKFLRPQIAQLDVLANKNIIMYPQIGQQTFELGMIDNWQSKLKRLVTFYQEIIPRKGWAAFKKVKLQYDKQIVCE
ncbi:MAG: hypothetical protein EAZ44_04025 [Cytophagia bacterium]|nr:MAG: hypothetical protein EAY69_04015 [Cytophagales bacterium]TAG05097.1 MAG: hypothetical protein EAZ44_04025 [Cytophagia bacterium]TAG43748.1 MAG: hypothetical protein EAZ31_03580 [Cytophagia bacterium]TAH29088.1 MAG: hypothetical protein EAZ06_07875 [Cytophagales bacterium]